MKTTIDGAERRGFDRARWQRRLDLLRAEHQVPGAALAVLVDGEIHELVTGVLHRDTGVPVTTDSVFQCGSIAKVYTATLVMQLVDSGALRLDTRVVDVLPDFSVADPDVTAQVTIGHLLSHTSGIGGEFTLDTGRGDDCLARYVEACKDVGQDCPLGTIVSYCSTGYAMARRAPPPRNHRSRPEPAPTDLQSSMSLGLTARDPCGIPSTCGMPRAVA